MRRFSIAFLTISLSVFLSSLLVLGCGKKDDEGDGPPRPSKKKNGDTGTAPPVSTLKKVEAKEYGTLSGKVELQGDLTSAIAEANAFMKSAIDGNTDAKYCLTGEKEGGTSPFPIYNYEHNQQDYRVGANKGLGNVFVWIEPQPGYTFVIPEAQLAAVPKEVVISQPHCSFLPHCTVLFPSYYKDGTQVKTGQRLVMENDALVSHNAKITGEKNNPPGGSISPRKPDGTVSREVVDLRPEKGPVTIGCDIHKFMKGYIRVYDHPYAAITSVGADLKDPKKKVWENKESPAFGTYGIEGVPVGAKVKLFAWHEKLGWITAPSGDDLVLTKDGKKDFTAAAK